MNKSLATLVAAALAAGVGVAAHAQATDDNSVTRSSTTSAVNADGSTTTTTTTTTDTIKYPPEPTTLSRSEAKDAKTVSSGDYKARKKIAEANYAQNKADCKAAAYGALARACKHDAKAQEKKEKADARLIHEAEKVDINDNTR